MLSPWVLAQFEISWEKLAGLSGTAVLAAAVVGFLTGRIVAGYLYREAITDRDRWCKRAEDATELLRKSVESNEALTEQVRGLHEQVRDLSQTLRDIAAKRGQP